MQTERNKACLEVLHLVNDTQAATTPSGECIMECMQGRRHVEGWAEHLGCAKCCRDRHPTYPTCSASEGR